MIPQEKPVSCAKTIDWQAISIAKIEPGDK
jgi:hypothetical protein